MEAAIFDLDGTLIDSMYIWDRLAYDYINSLGYRVEKDIYKVFRKMSMEESSTYIKNRYNLDKSSKDIEKDMLGLLEYNYREVFQLKVGVLDFLNALKYRDIDMCLATATDERLVLPALERLDIIDYFKFVQTEDNTGVSKEDKEFYNIALERLEKDKKDVWVFEDAYYAIKSAKRGDFKVVAIKDDSNLDLIDKIKRDSDIYIESFHDLEVGSLWKNY